MKIAGIDYGSKLAGTTVIALKEEEDIRFFTSEKKKDADAMIEKVIREENCPIVYLDAPLSLPGIYRELPGYDSYFYRHCDTELKGMSPMFLGGLTARAMRLKANLAKLPCTVYETYPGALARHLELSKLNYKKKVGDLPSVISFLQKEIPFTFPTKALVSWHHVDALLALYSGWRHQAGEHQSYGREEEGLIVV